MNNNPEKIDNGQEEENMDYIQTIEQMRQNSVSKDKYDKLKEENKKLLNTLATGGQNQEEEEKVDVNNLWEDIFNVRKKPLTDMEVVDKLLKIRESCLENEYRDIFVYGGPEFVPEASDYASAQQAAEVYQKCLDEADKSPRAFKAALLDSMVESSSFKRR